MQYKLRAPFKKIGFMKSSPEVREMLAVARTSLERVLADSLKTTSTAGSCLYGAYLVRELVQQFVPGAIANIRGGDGCGDGGCRGCDKRMHGHYWVEVTLADGTCGVADITGDQFGYAPVQWLDRADATDKYVRGNQSVVDADVTEFEREIRFVPVDHPSFWPFAHRCKSVVDRQVA
ncbi:MAG TPA: hypothetical protein VFQ88_07410 [Nevskiaceae bacterium]|nr:hypothetical protein [Nevskiaceae bacterium]